MADKIEPVRVDITVEDQATPAIHKIDALLDSLADGTAIELEAPDAAKVEGQLSDVADEAERVDKVDATVDVTADAGQADAALTDVADTAERIDRADVKLDVTVDTDTLDKAARKMDDVDDAARRAGDGINTQGNAIADLTGPLGDASSSASDFAGVMEGAADIATDLATKAGLSASAVSKIGSAMTVAGIAVAAAAAAWTLYRQSQEKANEAARKALEIQEELAEGKVTEAAEKMVEANEGVYESWQKLGSNALAVTAFLTGQTTALGELETAGMGVEEMMHAIQAAYGGTTHDALMLAIATLDARQAFGEAGEKLRETNTRVQETSDVMAGLAGAEATAAEEAEAFADEQERIKKASEEATEAVQAQHDAMRAQADSTFALHNAQDDWLDTLAGLEDQVAEVADGTGTAEEKTRDLQRVYITATDSAVAMADAQVQMATDTAAASGAALDADQAQRVWNDAMLESAATADGPLQQSILDYIATVNGIPPEKVSEILALIDQGKIVEAETLLNDTSRQRDAEMYADADTADAEAALGKGPHGVSRDRTARIYADVYGPGATMGVRGPDQPTLVMDPTGALVPAGVGAAPRSAGGAWMPAAPSIPTVAPITVNLTVQTITGMSRADSERAGAVIARHLAAFHRVNPRTTAVGPG